MLVWLYIERTQSQDSAPKHARPQAVTRAAYIDNRNIRKGEISLAVFLCFSSPVLLKIKSILVLIIKNMREK